MPKKAQVERLVSKKLNDWEEIAIDVNCRKFNIFDFFGKDNLKEKNRNLIALVSVFSPYYENDKQKNFELVPQQLRYRTHISGPYPHFFSTWVSSIFDVNFSRDETKILNLIFAQHEFAKDFLHKSYNRPFEFDINLKHLVILFEKKYPVAKEPQMKVQNPNLENNSHPEVTVELEEETTQANYFHIPFLTNLNLIFNQSHVLGHNIFSREGQFIEQKKIYWKSTNTPNFSTLQNNLKFLKYSESLDERPPISQQIKQTSGFDGGPETKCYGSFMNGKATFIFIINVLLLFAPAETKHWITLNFTKLKRIDVKSSDDPFHPNFQNIEGPTERRCFYLVASIATAPYEKVHHVCIKPHNGCGLKKENLFI